MSKEFPLTKYHYIVLDLSKQMERTALATLEMVAEDLVGYGVPINADSFKAMREDIMQYVQIDKSKFSLPLHMLIGPPAGQSRNYLYRADLFILTEPPDDEDEDEMSIIHCSYFKPKKPVITVDRVLIDMAGPRHRGYKSVHRVETNPTSTESTETYMSVPEFAHAYLDYLNTIGNELVKYKIQALKLEDKAKDLNKK